MSVSRNLLLTSMLSVFAVLATTACPVVTDVDRTQPNRVKKSLFEGEWLFTQTVIGVPYSTSFTFIGEQQEVAERVKWDIQEGFLIAYRAYDLVENTDRPSALPGDHVENVPVAVFPITSHFDVQRDYNPSTGEQTNVLVENTSDRPWYDRDFMRVDWSQNLAANFTFLVGGVTQIPGSHFVQKPGDPDALLFAQRDGRRWTDYQGTAIGDLEHAEYFDVVHRIFATPETIYIEDWDGTVYEEPACWYYTDSDCFSAEITIRSAFLKVDPDERYRPLRYPDNEILRDDDGNPIRVTYSGVDNMSLTPDPDGFVARAPFFDKFGFFRTERDSYDRQFGETESGREYLINRFQIWDDEEGCVIPENVTPYADCEVTPIEFYLSPGFPENLVDEAEDTIAQWNLAFKEVVRALKYPPGTSLDNVENVVLLRQNAFKATEDGKLETRGQRMGDIRYNMLAWVDQPNLAGLLGYGPAVIDPTSGEIINASAFIYGAGVDGYAQDAVTTVGLIRDPSRLDEYLNGEDVSRHVVLNDGHLGDINARQKTMAFVNNHVHTPRNQARKEMGLRAIERQGGETRARLDAIADTPLEQRLMTDQIVRAMGGAQSPSDLDSADVVGRARPQQWAMGRGFSRERQRDAHLSRHRVMHRRQFDSSIFGIVEEFEGVPEEELYEAIRGLVFRSTALHEVGHNFGLRHNFEGSSDALNYGRAYWDLKGTGGQALDPITDAQARAGMREHQTSSIMDYGSRFMSDIHGLGHYDKAAIAFGYGLLVEVFGAAPDEPLLDTYSMDDILRHWRHYTKLPEIFGGIDGMYDRELVPYRKLIAQFKGESEWNLWEVPYRFCSDEYDGFNATCASFDEGADAYEVAESARRLYLEYIPLIAFQRDRRGFSEWGYMSTVWSRAFWPMLTQYQNWVLDSYFWEYDWDDFRANWDLDYYRIEDVPWSQADDGGLAGAAASRLLLDTITEVLAMPEPGSYEYSDLEEILYLSSYAEGQGSFDVPFGVGRYTDSLWDGDSGYYFYDRLWMVGSFYDKMLALETAVTSDTFVYGVDTGSDVARYAIGLSLMFPEEIYKIVGATAAEDYPQIAGYACADGSYEVPKQTAAEAPCGGGAYQLVDPATSFTVELFAIWYGMAFLPMSFDLAFNDRMKIWLDGSGEGFTPADPALVVSFTNPLNNRTYHATESADPGSYDPAAALLQRAQRFADAYENDPSESNRWLLEALVSTIEDVRGTYDIYGTFYF